MKIMAVDLGDSRTGLALCDKSEFLASPLTVIHDKDLDSVLRKIVSAVNENKIEEIIVGYPKNMNGTVGERAEKCEEFAKRLSQQVQVEVKLWDERGTTVSAINYLNETKYKRKKTKECYRCGCSHNNT